MKYLWMLNIRRADLITVLPKIDGVHTLELSYIEDSDSYDVYVVSIDNKALTIQQKHDMELTRTHGKLNKNWWK